MISTYMSISIENRNLYICIRTYTYVDTYIPHIRMYIYIYVCTYLCTYICIYVYMCNIPWQDVRPDNERHPMGFKITYITNLSNLWAGLHKQVSLEDTSIF